MLLFHLDSFPSPRPNDTHARIPMPCDPQPWSLFIPISSTMPSHFSPSHHIYTSSGGLSSPPQNLDLSSSTPPTKVSLARATPLPRQNPQTHPNPTATRPAEGVFHKMQELQAVVLLHVTPVPAPSSHSQGVIVTPAPVPCSDSMSAREGRVGAGGGGR